MQLLSSHHFSTVCNCNAVLHTMQVASRKRLFCGNKQPREIRHVAQMVEQWIVIPIRRNGLKTAYIGTPAIKLSCCFIQWIKKNLQKNDLDYTFVDLYSPSSLLDHRHHARNQMILCPGHMT